MSTRDRPEMQLAGRDNIHVVRGITDRMEQDGCSYVRYLCGNQTTFGLLGQHPRWSLLKSDGPVTCMNCLRMLAGRKPFEAVS